MKIVVAIKQVPSGDSVLRVNAGGNWIQDSDLSYEINEPDAYALEAGLQLKEKHGGECVIVCLGPARAAQTIREALAKGADRAIHVEHEEQADADPLLNARLMAAALASEKPDLLLTGLQSDDFGSGQTGVILAELMGVAHATIVMDVQIEGDRVTVKRELEDGWFQHVEMALPALLTMQSGSNRLRYATLMGIKKAKTKEIRTIPANGLGVSSSASIRLQKVYLPERTKQSQIFDGAPKEAAAKLVEKLRFEARVL